MAYQIHFTNLSLADLDAIMDRALVEHETMAERFGESLLNHAELLREFPYLGVAIGCGRRRLLHSPFHIYYKVNEEKRRVDIVRFWYTSRRPPKFTSR